MLNYMIIVSDRRSYKMDALNDLYSKINKILSDKSIASENVISVNIDVDSKIISMAAVTGFKSTNYEATALVTYIEPDAKKKNFFQRIFSRDR